MTENLCLEIRVCYFHDFDRGESITQVVPNGWGLEIGQRIKWACVKATGHAEIVSLSLADQTHRATFRKIS